MGEHKRRHGHPLQPKMLPSCDTLLYHWNLASRAERVGLSLCNGTTTLPHRFSVQPINLSSIFKSCGDGGVAKRQVIITGSHSHKPECRWPLGHVVARLLNLGQQRRWAASRGDWAASLG